MKHDHVEISIRLAQAENQAANSCRLLAYATVGGRGRGMWAGKIGDGDTDGCANLRDCKPDTADRRGEFARLSVKRSALEHLRGGCKAQRPGDLRVGGVPALRPAPRFGDELGRWPYVNHKGARSFARNLFAVRHYRTSSRETRPIELKVGQP